MDTISILEAASLVEAKADSDTWRVRLIQEGQGSSGYYSADLLENYGHAFSNTVSFLNHTDDPSSRNFTEIAGRVVGDVSVEKDENGLTGLYADWRPDDDHKRKLEQYKDTLGLSIFITGEGRYDESSDRFLVESFDANDPYRSVDVVIAPGANGRFLESMKKVYSSRVSEGNERPGARQAEEIKEIKMDKELQEALDAIKEALAGLVAEKSQVEAEKVQAEADETAVASAVEAYAVAVEAIDKADLFESQRTALLESAKSGKDITKDIEAAKQIKDEAVASVQVEGAQGRTIGGEDKGFSLAKIAEAK